MLYQGVVQPVIICKILGHKAVALSLVQTALLVSLGLHLDLSNGFILDISKTGILCINSVFSCCWSFCCIYNMAVAVILRLRVVSLLIYYKEKPILYDNFSLIPWDIFGSDYRILC